MKQDNTEFVKEIKEKLEEIRCYGRDCKKCPFNLKDQYSDCLIGIMLNISDDYINQGIIYNSLDEMEWKINESWVLE